ncbi:MAG: hypothetical protein GY771_11785, partial [bacterium]|nr:hypothetical protein [bacterium]
MPGETPVIAITMGDPCGVGPEVIAKAIAKYEGIDKNYALLLIGDINVWEDILAALDLTVDMIRFAG